MNFASQVARPRTRTRLATSVSRARAEVRCSPIVAMREPVVAGARTLAPPAVATTVSIGATSSATATRAPPGAAIQSVVPPCGLATGATSSANAGMPPLVQATGVPDRRIARSQSRIVCGGATSSPTCTRGGGAIVQSASASSRSAFDAVSVTRCTGGRNAIHTAPASVRSDRTRRPRSIAMRRRSSREGIHHQVHGELRVVHREKALVVRMISPLRRIVLVAVQHRDPPVAHHSLEVLVHQVVSPAVELVACRRWALLEMKERAIERMVVGHLDQRRHRPGDLLGRGLVKRAVDVVVVIVDEKKAATSYELRHVYTLGGREPDWQMTGEIHQGMAKDVARRERDDRSSRS